MANPEHLKILKQGVEAWNKWREENPELEPDLSNIDLRGGRFFQANFSKSSFSKSNLEEAWFHACNLSNTDFSYSNLSSSVLNSSDLSGCSLYKSNIQGARFARSDLSKAKILETFIYNTDFELADFSFANLRNLRISRSIFKGANFRDADLSESQIFASDLEGAVLIKTNLTKTILSNVGIYGVAVWDIVKIETYQENLLITPSDQPEITVDDLEVAQFIYLMLNNQKIRDVIETITSKAVLILGRFTPERKAILDAIKDNLRKHQGKYLPIVFDFEGPVNQKTKDTVLLLARMSKFIIVDVSDPSCAPYEIGIIEQSNIRVPIQPIIQKPQQEFAMLPSDSPFLPIYRYDTQESLLENIASAIITPAEQKVAELRGK